MDSFTCQQVATNSPALLSSSFRFVFIDCVQYRNSLDASEGECFHNPRRDANARNDRRRGGIVAQVGRGTKPRLFFPPRFDPHRVGLNFLNNLICQARQKPRAGRGFWLPHSPRSFCSALQRTCRSFPVNACARWRV